MAKYFMHLRNGIDELLDPEGREFATLDALRSGVLHSALDLMAGDVQQGRIDLRYWIDAHDEKGTIVFSLPFKDAVKIISESDETPSL